jgi:hypothetical protein
MAAIGRKGRAPWTKVDRFHLISLRRKLAEKSSFQARVLSFFTGWRVYVLPLLYIIWVRTHLFSHVSTLPEFKR